MDRQPFHLVPLVNGRILAVVALSGAVAAMATWLAGGVDAAVAGGVAAMAAGAAGLWLGRAAQARADQLRLYRVSDELVQYRAFTQLLRTQGDRIVHMSGDAALTLAGGLREMDDRAGRLADALARAGAGTDLRDQAAAVAAPVVDLVACLQFQDVTRQQLGFLSRLSLILDDHMADLGRTLGDRRSLDRVTRFQELFDQALDDTVMTSQRNDHRRAAGGLELFEDAGPAIELFAHEEEGR